MPPKKRPAAGPLKDGVNRFPADLRRICPTAFRDPAWQESLWEKQLRLAVDRLEIAQNGLKTAKTKKEVEAAKKEVEAAEKKVEAAEKNGSSPGQVSLHLRGTADSKFDDEAPPKLKLEKFKADELLKVEALKDFVAPNTTAARPLFLRQHLLKVYNKAVVALQAKQIRLVSLVGCPGTGKTWCEGGQEDPAPHHQELDRDGHRQLPGEEAVHEGLHRGREHGQAGCGHHIFIGIRQLIEDGKFACVKFMGLLSGGQEKITGKQLSLQVIQKLVLWSWSEEEVATLCTKLKDASEPPSDEAYKVCGGSVRYLFRHEEDANRTREAVKGLSQDEMQRLLSLDMTVDDQQGKNRSRLLSFFPSSGKSNATDESFAKGVSEARPMPRSDFVIKCIKENENVKFEDVLSMYRKLSGMNPGAAGSAFEILVHLFWREAAAKEQKVQLSLFKGEEEEVGKVEVDFEQLSRDPSFQKKPKSIEEYEEEAVEVVEKFKSAGKTETEVLAIQISTLEDFRAVTTSVEPPDLHAS
ncbi:unnamed protein product [Symbiodinium sp. CCMP2592]|nr:unnamed protein product [Symbiodinium sp. CCMP2592]